MKQLHTFKSWGTPQELTKESQEPQATPSDQEILFTSEISSTGHNPQDTSITLFKTPTEWGTDVYIEGGLIKWYLLTKATKRGLFIEDVVIESIKLVIMSIEDAEDGTEHNFTMNISRDQLDALKLTYEINKPPLTLNSIDIRMNLSEDPHDWSIDLELGV
jgi:hypothetical protein